MASWPPSARTSSGPDCPPPARIRSSPHGEVPHLRSLGAPRGGPRRGPCGPGAPAVDGGARRRRVPLRGRVGLQDDRPGLHGRRHRGGRRRQVAADRPGARETRRDLDLMLDLTVLGTWRPEILETVASTGEGVEELWAAIGRHRRQLIEGGTLDEQRRRRLTREFHQILMARLEHDIDRLLAADRFAGITGAMAAGELDPYEAADRLLSGMVPDPDGPTPDS